MSPVPRKADAIRRDYSQALDVGTLSRGLDIPLLRVLVWVLGFMQFGYATEEFEVLFPLHCGIHCRSRRKIWESIVRKNISIIPNTMLITWMQEHLIPVCVVLS